MAGPARAEQGSQESAPRVPIRTLMAKEVGIADVREMVRIVGGRAYVTSKDFPTPEIAYLEHPLGITVRFGEVNSQDPVTTIAFEPLAGSPSMSESHVGNVDFEEAHVSIFTDSVEIGQMGYVGPIVDEPNAVDMFKITPESTSFERRLLPSR